MQRIDSRLIWGPFLILLGLLFLLQNLGALAFLGEAADVVWAFLWMTIFGVVGLLFLVGLLINRENWWMAIPGFTLLGLSGTVAVSEFMPWFPFEGSIFLGAIGLGFLAVYLLNPQHWWAIIPGGVMLTLAIVAGLDEVSTMDTGSVFMIGLGLTFALVGLLRDRRGRRMWWAFIPAAVLLLIGLAIGFSMENLLGAIWPLLLIGLGLYILYRSLFRPERQ
jgi:hypothetical protein